MPTISTTDPRDPASPSENKPNPLLQNPNGSGQRLSTPGPAEPPPGRNRKPYFFAVAFLVAVLLIFYAIHHLPPVRRFESGLYPRSLFVEQAGFTLIPESERPLDRVVVGISQAVNHYWMLPPVQDNPKADLKRINHIKKLMYWVDLEMAHGQIWSLLPAETVFYVAIPQDPDTGKRSTLEKDWFTEYLRLRWGWDNQTLSKRLRFFDSPMLIWTQDMGEVLGRDPQDRTVIALGANEPKQYRGTALALVNNYPDDFAIRETSPAVSTEGGDLELVWGPDGRPDIVAGRFAAIRYLQRTRGDFPMTQRVPFEQALEAQRVFSGDFFGLPVQFLPKSVLQDSSKGDPELFHLDMLATFFAGDPRPRAFLPIYQGAARDATTGKPLDPAFQNRLQGEYNRAALELSSLGYEVQRLPFADHPVRGPVNLVKYYDRARNRQVVLLPKYPDHIARNGSPSAQDGIFQSLNNLQNWYWFWNSAPTDQNFNGLMSAFQFLWGTLKNASGQTNPFFDEQQALLEKCGYIVIPVPMYPWGAGGLHCQTLH
jgi:hypothetical protein